MGGSGDCSSPSNGDSEGGCSPLRAASRFSCLRCCLSARFSATARSRLRLLIVCCRFLLAISPSSRLPDWCRASRDTTPAGNPVLHVAPTAGRTRAFAGLTRQRDVLCLGALLPLGGLVLDLRTLSERPVAVDGDRRMVHEQILAAAL